MSDSALARLLDSPFLARVVPHLAPETLHQLIRYRGLDACGELVTAATPAQLTSLFDLDLWRHARPGRDEQFDVERFGEWLEALVNIGDSTAARTVAVLDTNLVVAGLSRYVRVFDPGIFEPTAQSDDEATDRHEAMREGGGGWLECEVGGYLLRARRTDAWDAVVRLLVALETEHNHCFQAVMQGCRSLSNSNPEASGFHDLLLAPEQHLHDLTIEREQRRSQQGYATPADARAFLEMARQPKHARAGMNPIVTAYFRAADETPEPANETARAPEHKQELLSSTFDVAESLEAVIELLTEAGVMPGRPRALLAAAQEDPQTAKLAHLRRLMDYVRDTDETAFLARSRELAFLANTLLAGCSIQSRPFTTQEASDAAASICNLGLEHGADSLSIERDLVSAFEAGWSVLHKEVAMFVAQQLVATVDAIVHAVDRDSRLGLVALRRALVKQMDAGTPWRARDAAEILAMLDTTAWVGVLGLLDECPIMPAALTAILDGRTTTVSPTEFEFISTADQIGNVRIFMRKLPGVLSR